MASIYRRIENLRERDWNYYAGFQDNVPIEKPFITDNSSVNFINQYFYKGGKKQAMKDFDLTWKRRSN
jgi:hypothetical protein